MPFARSHDTEIFYTVRGSGPPVLLVAGTGYSGQTWHPGFLADLEQRNTVITFDHRGTGRSRGSDDDYDTQLFAADAIAVVKAVGVGGVDVVGHSMGGRVAQWIAVSAGALVRRLVLVSTGLGAPSGSDFSRVGIPVPATLGLMQLGYRGYVAHLQRTTFFTDEFGAEHPEELTWLEEAFWHSRPALPDYLKHVRARQAHSARDVVAEIVAPTLVLVGELDTHAGGTGSHMEQSLELHRLLPDSELRIMDGVRHGLFWERPAQTAQVVADWCGP